MALAKIGDSKESSLFGHECSAGNQEALGCMTNQKTR